MKAAAHSSLTRGTRILTALYGLILVILSVMPSVEVPGVGISDWILHAVAYGGLGGLLLVSGLGAAGSIAGACGFGLATEILQLLVPYRRFQLSDLIADAAGALVVVIFGLVVTHMLHTSTKAER